MTGAIVMDEEGFSNVVVVSSAGPVTRKKMDPKIDVRDRSSVPSFRMEIGRRYRLKGVLVECVGRNKFGGFVVRRVGDLEDVSAIGSAAAKAKHLRERMGKVTKVVA